VGERNAIRRDWQCESEELAERVRDKQEHERYDCRRRRTEVEEHVEGTGYIMIVSLGDTVCINEKETDLLVMHNNNPTNHILIVIAGISGSSIFDTEARTSGNGLSSSSIASKSKSILENEVERVSFKLIGWSTFVLEEVQITEEAMQMVVDGKAG